MMPHRAVSAELGMGPRGSTQSTSGRPHTNQTLNIPTLDWITTHTVSYKTALCACNTSRGAGPSIRLHWVISVGRQVKRV
jgi:hypothetical protein